MCGRGDLASKLFILMKKTLTFWIVQILLLHHDGVQYVWLWEKIDKQDNDALSQVLYLDGILS